MPSVSEAKAPRLPRDCGTTYNANSSRCDESKRRKLENGISALGGGTPSASVDAEARRYAAEPAFASISSNKNDTRTSSAGPTLKLGGSPRGPPLSAGSPTTSSSKSNEHQQAQQVIEIDSDTDESSSKPKPAASKPGPEDAVEIDATDDEGEESSSKPAASKPGPEDAVEIDDTDDEGEESSSKPKVDEFLVLLNDGANQFRGLVAADLDKTVGTVKNKLFQMRHALMSHKKVKSGDIVKVYDDLVSVESGMDVNDVTLVAPIFRSVYSKSNIEHPNASNSIRS